MVSYKLSLEAELDLIRIHQYGVRQFGVEQADQYFYALYKQFEQIAGKPYSYPSAEDIRPDYRRCICGVDTIYYPIVGEGCIEVMAVIGRQDFKQWL